MSTDAKTTTTNHHNPAHGKMLRLINQLIQLQELIFAREQQEATMPGNRLAQLDAAIQGMFADLPADVSTHFQKMHRKGNLSIVPIATGVCSACAMAIPVSQVHAVHAADRLYMCPNCARYLFYPESPIKRVGQKRRRGEPIQVGVARFSSPAVMLPHIDATDAEDAIGAIARHMEAEGFIDNAQRLAEEAMKREAIASTAVDHGLAFPHVRGVEGGGLTMALATSKKGIRFSGSKTLTRAVFLMVIPTAASAFYLRLLSGLTQSFRDEDARELLIKAGTPDELWKALTKATRTTIQ